MNKQSNNVYIRHPKQYDLTISYLMEEIGKWSNIHKRLPKKICLDMDAYIRFVYLCRENEGKLKFINIPVEPFFE